MKSVLIAAALFFGLAANLSAQEDWANLGRYCAENERLRQSGRRPDIVFLGDSITEGWINKQPEFFRENRVNRGIGGQTTPQMLLRFRADVVDLHPKLVQIMAGTNDIAGNTGPMTDQMTEENFKSMVDLARINGIKVIIAAIPPAANFPWRPGLETNQHIQRFNRWLKAFAKAKRLVYADYWSALQDGQGGLRAEWAVDGVHPNELGYQAMAPVAEAAMRSAGLGGPKTAR
jgi:lysophospholipase L1-like esterase